MRLGSDLRQRRGGGAGSARAPSPSESGRRVASVRRAGERGGAAAAPSRRRSHAGGPSTSGTGGETDPAPGATVGCRVNWAKRTLRTGTG